MKLLKIFFILCIPLFALAQSPELVDVKTGEFKGPASRNLVKYGNRFIGYTSAENFRFEDYASVIADNNLVTATGGQLSYLTPGVGLTGEAFNGSAALEWTLNIGDGLEFDAQNAASVSVDFVQNIVRKMPMSVSGYQISIDTTPSVNLEGTAETKTVSGSVEVDFQNYTYSARSGMHNAALSGSPDVLSDETSGLKYVNLSSNTQNIAIPADVGGAKSITLSMRIRLSNAVSATQYFLTSGHPGFSGRLQGDIFVFQYWASQEAGFRQIVVGGLDYEWHTYTLVVDEQSLTFTLYRDGVKHGSIGLATVAEADILNAAIKLSGSSSEGSTPMDFTDIRYFKRAITADEAIACANAEYVPGSIVTLANDIEGTAWYNTPRQRLNYGGGISNAEARSIPISMNVSLPKITAWSDGEVKIIRNADGMLMLWISTQQGGSMGADYLNHPARDPNARIFYTLAGSANDGRNWIERKDTDSDSNYAHALSRTSSAIPQIGGTVIQPNIDGETLGGTKIRDLFEKPGYSIIYIKCSPQGIERSTDGRPMWRPAVPTPLHKEAE